MVAYGSQEGQSPHPHFVGPQLIFVQSHSWTSVCFDLEFINAGLACPSSDPQCNAGECIDFRIMILKVHI